MSWLVKRHGLVRMLHGYSSSEHDQIQPRSGALLWWDRSAEGSCGWRPRVSSKEQRGPLQALRVLLLLPLRLGVAISAPNGIPEIDRARNAIVLSTVGSSPCVASIVERRKEVVAVDDRPLPAE